MPASVIMNVRVVKFLKTISQIKYNFLFFSRGKKKKNQKTTFQ